MKNSTKWRRVECFNKQTKHAIWLTSSFNEVLNIFLKFYSYHRNSLRQNEMVIIICLRQFFSNITFLHPIVLCNLLRSCPHRFKSFYKLGWLQEAFRTHKNVLNQFHSSCLQSVCPWCSIFFLFFVCLSRIATAWRSKSTVAEEERNHALWLFSNGTIRLDGKEKNLFFKGKKLLVWKLFTCLFTKLNMTQHMSTQSNYM